MDSNINVIEVIVVVAGWLLFALIAEYFESQEIARVKKKLSIIPKLPKFN